MLIQTEYEFTLPKGYVDEQGTLHRQGRMRLATALDEIEAARNPGAKSNPEYQSVILLSRVVMNLGGIGEITPELIGGLFTPDFAYLQNMYETVNKAEDPIIRVQCPHCGKTFTDTLNFAIGE
ncbi:MAG: hypothetical protein NC399_07430 [Muribaculum sp.]|nr:hypothetical protein [Muribaculum sp.]